MARMPRMARWLADYPDPFRYAGFLVALLGLNDTAIHCRCFTGQPHFL